MEAADPDNDLTQERLLVKLEAFVRKLRTELAQRQPSPDSAEEIADMVLEFVGTPRLRQSFPLTSVQEILRGCGVDLSHS